MGRRRPSHHWCAHIQPRGPLTVAAAPPWLQQLLALSPGGQDRLWTASSSSAVGSEWPCCFFNDAQTQAPPCAAATALLPRYPTNLLLCVAGIFIFPWGGDTADWYPLDGGAYAGLNVALGPHLQVIPTPSHVLGRISPIFSPFFPVFCAFSPSRRGGSNEPQAGTQGQETVARGSKHRFSGLANSGCWERMAVARLLRAAAPDGGQDREGAAVPALLRQAEGCQPQRDAQAVREPGAPALLIGLSIVSSVVDDVCPRMTSSTMDHTHGADVIHDGSASQTLAESSARTAC